MDDKTEVLLEDISASTTQFLKQLCEEHLEEAAALHNQCINILQRPSWDSAIVFEKRLEAHLDALSVIGPVAFEICKDLSDKDTDDLYVIVRLYFAARAFDELSAVIVSSDLNNEKTCRAIQNAFVDEGLFYPKGQIDLPCELQPNLKAGICSNLRIQDASSLAGEQNTDIGPDIFRLPGRLFQTEFEESLKKALDHRQDLIRFEAALSLLRLGHYKDPIKCCKTHHHFLLLGIAGSRTQTTFFLRQFSNGHGSANKDLVLGFGLLGTVEAIPVLIGQLSEDVLSQWAAMALELITGAGLEETVFIPDELDEDELFEHEIEQLKQGKPLFPPGQEPGIHVTRITQDQNLWQAWYQENEFWFKKDVRYRNGQPICPEIILNDLKSDKYPAFLRQLFYEEIVIRYGRDFAFETIFPATIQMKAIEKYEAWLGIEKSKFKNGLWYFSGQPMK